MSLGQTTSAPASTCETAVRAISSTEASLSISTAPARPSWKRRSDRASCTRTGTRRSAAAARGSAARSARSACCTIPSAIQAPLPSSSFSSGMPNSSTALTPARSELLALAHDPVDRVPRQPRQALVAQRLRRDEERHARGRRARAASRGRGRAARACAAAGAAGWRGTRSWAKGYGTIARRRQPVGPSVPDAEIPRVTAQRRAQGQHGVGPRRRPPGRGRTRGTGRSRTPARTRREQGTG